MSIGEVSINFDVVLVDNFVSFCLEDVSNDATSSFDIVLIVLSVCVIFFSGVGVGFVIFMVCCMPIIGEFSGCVTMRIAT